MNQTSLLFAQRALLACALAVIICLSCTAYAASAPKAQAQPSPDIVIGDFEGAGWEGWVTTGTAFGPGPLHGQAPASLDEVGVRGDGVASSERAGDGPTGTLTSPRFQIARRYLSFVIGGGNYERNTCLNLIVGGKIVRSATGEDSDNLLPESWNVSQWRGQTAWVQVVDNATGDWGHVIVDHIIETDTPERMPVVTQPLYGETWRPQFHFSARQWTEERLNPGQREEGWINDLNGLIYYDGVYHLFAQRWNKCWLHAVSRDLVHWTELEPAFWEESLGSGVQSGTCVVDYQNTSGLSPDKSTPPMVAFWSRNDNRSQCITYSLDHGRTWHLYAKNPVLDFPERDPMVFWYAPGRHWVMVMYGDGQYHIFTSPNLLDWTDTHHPIPNSFECPDMFQLPVDNDPHNVKWVLVRGNGKYSVGDFDGSQFTEETPQYLSDAGPNFYATQCFGNVNTGDGRIIQLAWMRGGVYPDMPFNQQITFPCQLTLHTTPSGLRLFREPVREIALLHKQENRWPQRTLTPGQTWDLHEPGDLFQVKMAVQIPQGATLTLNIRGVPLVMTHNTVACGTDPQPVSSALQTVEVLIDRTSIETFANHGEVSLSRCFLPNDTGLTLTAEGGNVTITSLSVFQLNSAWPHGK